MMLVWVLLAAVVLVLLVAALPLCLELALDKREAWAYRAVLHPLAGLGPRIVLSDGKEGSRSKTPKPDKKRAKAHAFWRDDTMRSVRAVTRLATGILRRVRIDNVVLDMKFGLGDPAETGQAFGMLAPMIYGSVALPRTCLRVEPDFGRITLRGHGRFAVSLIPITLLPLLARFGWSVFGPRQ